ncbi:MAG: HTH domain-containing protein [Chloroflexi bacterium]|nr:HTH domain-containing protein [Chloroflexota bacterium]
MSETASNEGDALQQTLLGERDRLQKEIDQLRQQVEIKEQRLSHVLALLASAPPVANQPPARRTRQRTASTPSSQLLDMAEKVLRERNGEPMHYRELADELFRRGAVILGKDPASALVSRMTQDDNRRAEGEQRFVRPVSKGFYALREDYPNARNVGAKRRRRNVSEPGNDKVNLQEGDQSNAVCKHPYQHGANG